MLSSLVLSISMEQTNPKPSVEVIYATAETQTIVRVELESGLTAERAVNLSGLLDSFPEIAEQPLVLGAFGARVAGDHVLESGDRVEICRPLVRDPRSRRRELSR